MRPHCLVFALVLSTVTRPAQASDFSTPEAALHEHQVAWANRDIDRFLFTISFRQEAIEALHGKSSTDETLDETAIQALALERQNELRRRLATMGFKPDYLASCKIIKRWPVSEFEVRLPLYCTDRNGSMFFAIRLVRTQDGWRVVRGQTVTR